jgi:hypothetical protein
MLILDFSHVQIERFFKLAMNDGVMEIVYRKVKFDWHSGLIFSLMRYPVFKNLF